MAENGDFKGGVTAAEGYQATDVTCKALAHVDATLNGEMEVATRAIAICICSLLS